MKNTIDRLNNNKIIFNIVITALLLSLTLVFKAIFKDINLINGFSPQIQLLVFSLGLWIIPSIYYKFIFYLLTPFLMLIFGFSGHLFFDQILPYWCFIGFIFIDKIYFLISKKINIKEKISSVLTLSIIWIIISFFSYLFLWISYSISGVLMYSVIWQFSLSFNAPISWISFGISLIIIPSLYFLEKLKMKYSKYGYKYYFIQNRSTND